MSVSKRSFGNISTGQEATLYTIKDKSGMMVKVTDYGASVVSVVVPDRDGELRDVVLGFDNVSGYEFDDNYLGGVIGRCADRVKDGEILINGKRYMLFKNDGNNNRHSGPHTYNKRMWRLADASNNSVSFELISQANDQGFPGELEIEVKYTLSEGNRFIIEYKGISDADTIMNLSNRILYNLNGAGEGSVERQFVWICAERYARLDEERIPTGDLDEVFGTLYDFTTRRMIGMTQGDLPRTIKDGYSVSYALPGTESTVDANMYSTDSGILMNVYTDLPCLKLYVPEELNIEGKNNALYGALPGACLAAQYLPDAIHHPGFDSPIIRSGEEVCTRTVYEFQTVEKE